MNDAVTSSAEATRVTIALMPRAAAGLAALTGRTGQSKTDLVNRAITAYDFIDAQLSAGRDLLVRDRETGAEQIVKFL